MIAILTDLLPEVIAISVRMSSNCPKESVQAIKPAAPVYWQSRVLSNWVNASARSRG